jgi:hypothetical protein
VQLAYSYIPDGTNLKIDIDPETHEIVATTTGHDGREQSQVVDPGAIPGLLKQAMDGSAYWSTMFQIGQPQLAQQQMVNDAGMQRQLQKEQFDRGWESEKDAREVGQEQDRYVRNTKLKLWEHDRDSAEGRDASERTKVKDDAFFADWNQRLAGAAEGSPERQQLFKEGLGYLYQNTPTRKEPTQVDFEFSMPAGGTSPYTDTFGEDKPLVQQIAKVLANKNQQLEGNTAMDMAAALILAPADQVVNEPDGSLSVDQFSLVFNPGLLPLLGQLRKKYKQQE